VRIESFESEPRLNSSRRYVILCHYCTHRVPEVVRTERLCRLNSRPIQPCRRRNGATEIHQSKQASRYFSRHCRRFAKPEDIRKQARFCCRNENQETRQGVASSWKGAIMSLPHCCLSYRSLTHDEGELAKLSLPLSEADLGEVV
jgi:hypothetical protein